MLCLDINTLHILTISIDLLQPFFKHAHYSCSHYRPRMLNVIQPRIFLSSFQPAGPNQQKRMRPSGLFSTYFVPCVI